MIELVLVRHAQPDWEPQDRAVDDPVLTPLGLEQAARVGDTLGAERWDAIHASPLVRAQQTAEPVARGAGLEIHSAEWLSEIRLPSLHGTPADEVHAFLAAARARNLEQWWDGIQGGESFRHFHERVTGGILTALTGTERADQPLLWKIPDRPQKILMVAHSGTIAVILSYLLGIEAVPWEWERFRLGWAGIVRMRTVRVGGAAVWALTSFNTRDHLSGLPDPES
ncbi:MAG: histidine phosphatase family protein [Armatimonadetes bacterium]|nr:histidine phosphatase family protein [Armatimonadota bacterium]